MKIVRALPLLIALLAACSGGGGGDADPGPLLGDDFTLGYGEQRTLVDEELTLGFVTLNSESRCPTGAQCIVAGSASITVTAARPGLAGKGLSLRIPGDGSKTYGPYRITLVDLQPHPTTAGQPQTTEYEATLRVEKP